MKEVTLSYFFENWNTDVVSIGCLLVLILLASGYFYGRLYQKFIPSLKNVDCTFPGIFTIFAIFEIYVFYIVSVRGDSTFALTLVKLLVLAGPILCLIFRANVIPSWKHLASFVAGVAIAVVLGRAAAKLTTNNIFFDTVYYLSQVGESVDHPVWGGYFYYQGEGPFDFVEVLHDYQGYYYFWAVLLRWVKTTFDVSLVSLIPIYIWGGSILYYMSLGSIFISSINVLYKKRKWFSVLSVFLLAPFFTNYFNTTLGFFGNTIRTVCVGWAMLIVYRYLRSHDGRLFIPLGVIYLAGIMVSSSCLFIFVFFAAAVLFTLAFSDKTVWQDYMGLVASSIGLIHFGIIAISPSEYPRYAICLGAALGITALCCGIVWLFHKKIERLSMVFKVLFPITMTFIVVRSFTLRNSEFGYAYFFDAGSYHDMCNNFTSHVSTMELWRNIVMYSMVALLVVNSKVNRSYKLFLMFLGAMFLNPLVEPFAATYLTKEAYCRAFDLLANPFTLSFLIKNTYSLLNKIYINWLLLPILSLAATVTLTASNLTIPYSKTLTFMTDSEDYNWEYKVTNHTIEMYDYITSKLVPASDTRLHFLSQDESLRGYVPGIVNVFGSNKFRDAMSSEDQFNKDYLVMSLMYPHRLTGANPVVDPDQNEVVSDYSRLGELISSYPNVDYVIMRNTVAIWDERGWFDKCYVSVLHSGQCSIEYENDEWVILRVNPDYTPDKTDLGEAADNTGGEVQEN